MASLMQTALTYSLVNPFPIHCLEVELLPPAWYSENGHPRDQAIHFHA